MNQVTSESKLTMPQRFADGLDAWSQCLGASRNDTWADAPNATLVEGDLDFGECLELQKSDDITRLRYAVPTPVIAGRHLRISARVKALSGKAPRARIAVQAAGGDVPAAEGSQIFGPVSTVPSSGSVGTVEAILGTDGQASVDIDWGSGRNYAYVGLDLIGPNGGRVRIEDLKVEDVTKSVQRGHTGRVDVRDHGAVGDGFTDDHAAFVAANEFAKGREIYVPDGSFFVGDHLNISNPIWFDGRIVMHDHTRLALPAGCNLRVYSAAFGSDQLGLKKGLQQLFSQSDQTVFDMAGRRVVLDAPLDVPRCIESGDVVSNRRVLRNGALVARPSSDWSDNVQTRTAIWSPEKSDQINKVANVSSIPVGALVSAEYGVGREVYVRSVDPAHNRVFLSKPLCAPPKEQAYTFTEFKYLLDFKDWKNLHNVEVSGVEFECGGHASALRLPSDGQQFRVMDCGFFSPKDRAITSVGKGCSGMEIDKCQFISSEIDHNVSDRSSIAFNANSNECKIRNNRAEGFRHFGVIYGSGHFVAENSITQGDKVKDGLRTAGLVIANLNAQATICGNHIQECFVEWTNEHDPDPDYGDGFSFHGLDVQGNAFLAMTSTRWMQFLSVKPFGAGHFVDGLTVAGNHFKKAKGASIFQAEGVDTAVANLDFGRIADVTFENNTYCGIEKKTKNPVTVRAEQREASSVWTVDLSDFTPFGAPISRCISVLPDGPVRSTADVIVYSAPWTQGGHGSGGRSLRIGWSQAVRGAAYVTARCDT